MHATVHYEMFGRFSCEILDVYHAQARDARTAEVVAIKKMSYSGKQSNEVSFPTFHSHYIQSCSSLVVDSAFPSEGGHRNDCITLPVKDFFSCSEISKAAFISSKMH